MTEKSREQKLRRAAKRANMAAVKTKDEYGVPAWLIFDTAAQMATTYPGNATAYMSIEQAEEVIFGE